MSTPVKIREYWITTLTEDIKKEQEKLLVESFGEGWKKELDDACLLGYMQAYGLTDVYNTINDLEKEIKNLEDKLRELRERKYSASKLIGDTINERYASGYDTIIYHIKNTPKFKKIQKDIIGKNKNGEKYLQLNDILGRIERDIMFATSAKVMQDIVEKLLAQIQNITK